MRTLYFFIFFFLNFYYLEAQNIQFKSSSNIDYNIADDKLIFLEIHTNWFKKEPERLDRYTIKDSAVVAYYNRNFENYRFYSADSAIQEITKLYKPKFFPSYYFLDKDGKVVYTFNKYRSNQKFYISLADTAFKRLSNGYTLGNYEQKLSNKTITLQELVNYINLRTEFQIFENAHLAEKLVEMMKEEDFNNPEYLLAIFKCGPILNSNAHKKLYTNSKLAAEVYRQQNPKHIPNFNRRITENSLLKAIDTNNEQLANITANFYQLRFHYSKYKTETHSPYILMRYYNMVKDTNNYLINVVKFYDNYLLVTKDSALKYEQKMHRQQSEQKNHARTIVNGEVKTTTYKSVSSTLNYKDYFAKRLYAGASIILNRKVKDPIYLYKGIDWCRKSSELAPDIYQIKVLLSKFYYLSGFYEEAEKSMKQAIALAKKNNVDLSQLHKQLEEISDIHTE